MDIEKMAAGLSPYAEPVSTIDELISEPPALSTPQQERGE